MNSSQSPRFVSLPPEAARLIDRPDEAATYLYQRHTAIRASSTVPRLSDDITLMMYWTEQLHNTSDAVMMKHFCSNFPEILWTMASDPWVCDRMYQDLMILRYACSIYDLLAIIGRDVSNLDSVPHETWRSSGSKLVLSSTRLWEKLYRRSSRKSKTFLQALFEVDGTGYFHKSVSDLCGVTVGLYETCCKGRMGSNYSYIPAILLHCWLSSDQKLTNQVTAVLLQTLSHSMVFLGDQAKDFARTHIIEPDLSNTFARAWIAAVKQPIVDLSLAILFRMLRQMGDFRGDHLNELESILEPVLPLLVAKAMRRQLCSGEDHPEGVQSDILRKGLDFLSLHFSSDRNTDERFELVIESSLIPILAKSLPWIASEPLQRSEKEIWIFCMEGISNLLNPPVRAHLNAAKMKGTAKIYKVLTKHWQPTLDKLRSLPPNTHPSRDYIIKEWTKFGRKVRLYDGEQHQDPPIPDDTSYHFKYCHNEECLCNDFASSHKMMICRGCWHAMYCNVKCQKSHWDNGHKDVCRRTPR